MVNKRCITIIEILMENRILTVNEIAKYLGVSERTIRYDVDKINAFLEQNNLKMIAKKPGKGIYFDLTQSDKNIINNVINSMNNYNYIMSENERIKYILCLLLKSNKYITINSIADEMSVSRSTIINDLDKVKLWLRNNNVNVDLKKAHGIKIKSSEENIRKAIISLFSEQNCNYKLFEFLNRNFIEKSSVNKKIFCNVDSNFIEKCIKSAEKQLEQIFSDEAFDALLVHITIAILRLKDGKEIKINKDELRTLKKEKEYIVASHMAMMIEKKFNVKIPEDEIGYIAIHLLSSNVTSIKNIEREHWIQIRICVSKIIENFEKISNMNFEHDNQLFNGLAQHLRPMFSRVRHNIVLKNPLLNDIKKSFIKTFILTRASLSFLEEKLGKKLSEDEIGYICIYFQTAIERNEINKKYAKNILIVCATGLGTAKFIESKIIDLFDVKIINTTSSRHYKEFLRNHSKDENKVDLIISTVKIDEKRVKTLYLNPILSKKDIYELSKYLSIRSNDKENKNVDKKVRKPNLIEVLNKDEILLNQKVDNWQQAVKLGGSLLCKNNIAESRYIDAMINNVNNMGPYIAILPGIAMPHAKPERGALKIGLSLLTLKKGINFGNKENDPIRIIISIVAIDESTHVKMLEQLMNVMEDKDFYRSIINANSKEDVISFMKQHVKKCIEE